jgi:hypothetical protein
MKFAKRCEKFYELKDHLGNVRIVAADIRGVDQMNGEDTLEIANISDNYPYGMMMPERHWFI